MSNVTSYSPERVSKREFVQRVARRADIPAGVAQKAYDAMIHELVDLVGKGNTVNLTGFGKFYPQPHKGHPVRTNIRQGATKAYVSDDYVVMKFSATRDVNKKVGGTDSKKDSAKSTSDAVSSGG